ncbi:ABC transporter ATP-binding protein [Spirosoma panaciterrae]|uniref:ABC transporter ATP-binding protein n=1 Tax=Spirosoma panaciterrae TaxID=496058 RepID=UPI00036D662C|nr:ABC transporter ATP-binding protein [Spirosoma panaciterrae]
MKPIIRVENLSKQYRLGAIGTKTIREDVQRWWHRIQGKEDPYLKIGETNDRSSKGNSDYVWALRDINFEVMPGEVLGIIGKNGAGKSTLLKILSKVTGPTTGRIDFNGRIGSLLEVGTGFHPDLTGRENIFLNGAILGMTKREIRSKLDEIIDFSGCERYIDTPVKRYSSGMTVRLGFAVAAHLDPEILIVDEVLAVGDDEFQKKALGKMQEISKNEGRTVLFVSHNMISIKKLCNSGLFLENGNVLMRDSISKVVNTYEYKSASIGEIDLSLRSDRKGSGKIKVMSCNLLNRFNYKTTNIDCGEVFLLDLSVKSNLMETKSKNIEIAVNICHIGGDRIIQLSNRFLGQNIYLNSELTRIQFRIDKFPLNPGKYAIRIFIANSIEIFDWIDNVLILNVEDGDFFKSGFVENSSVFFVDHSINIINN